MRRRRGLALAALASIALAGPAGAHSGAHPESKAAPPPEAPAFEPPAPGSYELPPIQTVARHRLLDARGEPASLPALAPGQVGFVAFVYLSCPSVCPQTLGVLQRLDRELASDPALRARVSIAAVSFDPARDDPAALARVRESLAPQGPWRFLTAPDRAGIDPVLADYGQDAVPLVDESGEPIGLLRHVLKVFLLDDRRRVRNVYSSDFLDWRLMRNDVLTLLGELPA